MINTYKLKKRKGIDDLEYVYAFMWTDQGSEGAGTNEIREYLDAEGWLSFGFKGIDIADQQAIYEESARRRIKNEEYIEQLKKEGRYGEEYIVKVQIVESPNMDSPQSSMPLMSYSFQILDISDTNGNI